MPIISVIIPSFNCAPFLPEALDSALAQSFSDIEIVVVDDGSTDNTRAVCQQYCSDSRVRYVYQENRGLPGARNRGVIESRGDYIAALDADDTLVNTALADMLAVLVDSEASWCITDIVKFWATEERAITVCLPEGDLVSGILKEDFVCRGMFFRKSALERVGLWDSNMRMREDWDLNIRMIRAGEKFVYLNRPVYRYRCRPNSITTGNPRPLFHYTEQVLRKHHKQLADAGLPYARAAYAYNMWDLARRHLYTAKDVRKSVQCAFESLRYDFEAKRILHPFLHKVHRYSRERR